MIWRRRISVQPSDEPLTASEVQIHCHIDDIAAESAWVSAHITAARRRCEELSGVATTTRACTLILDKFPDGRGPITLPWPPLASVTSVAYKDEDGDAQTYTVSDLQIVGVTNARECAEIYPAADEDWPTVEDQNPIAVVITFSAGVAQANVSELLKSGMLMHVGAMYLHREDTELSSSGRAISLLPESSKDLYQMEKVIWFGPENERRV